MKVFRLLSATLFLIALSNFGSAVFAQKTALPSELNKNSSLTDILSWLDKNGFAQARIGLESAGENLQPGDNPVSSTSYSKQAVFSQGFKLAKTEGCRLTLQNNDLKLLSFATANPDPSKESLNEVKKISGESRLSGVLTIPLEEIVSKKDSFRFTKKPDEAKLLGTWQTQFNVRSDIGFGLFIPTKGNIKEKIEEAQERSVMIKIKSDALTDSFRSMPAAKLTFTFDDKETSEKFYAALSQAVSLCKRD